MHTYRFNIARAHHFTQCQREARRHVHVDKCTRDVEMYWRMVRTLSAAVVLTITLLLSLTASRYPATLVVVCACAKQKHRMRGRNKSVQHVLVHTTDDANKTTVKTCMYVWRALGAHTASVDTSTKPTCTSLPCHE